MGYSLQRQEAEMYDAPSLPNSTIKLDTLPEVSVSALAQTIKRSLETLVGRVRVRGELSGLKRHSSGHIYCSLKDHEAVIDAVCWRGTPLKFALQDGMEVVCIGRITTYPGRSKYQIIIESLDHAGEGALLKLLEERKRLLSAEGLFDLEQKKPLPFLPNRIGIITSPTGAVIRDILHRLNDRFPRPISLWPVTVQGEGAAEQVARAIHGFNQMALTDPLRPDVLIIARGGGSIEDLWAFNEEIVVRATAASTIPTVSAIGHETDVTLIDYAADIRAPTPTAAAEMVVPVRSDILESVIHTFQRGRRTLMRTIEIDERNLASYSQRLGHPKRLLESKMQTIDDWFERLHLSVDRSLKSYHQRLSFNGLTSTLLTRRLDAYTHQLQTLGHHYRWSIDKLWTHTHNRLSTCGQLLESYSYKRILERGFILARNKEGYPLTSVSHAIPGDPIELCFYDGTIGAIVGETPPSSNSKKTLALKLALEPRTPSQRKKPSISSQEHAQLSLFNPTPENCD